MFFSLCLGIAQADGIDDDGDGYCDSDTCVDGSLPGDCNDDPFNNGLDFNPGLADGWGTPFCGDGLDHDCSLNDGISEPLADDDSDGMNFQLETVNSLDDCDPDYDDDNLLDGEEFFVIGTDAKNPDTDSDNVRDDHEVGDDISSPLNTDSDGLIDALDTDDDNDTLPTITEDWASPGDPLSTNTDEDGNPDFRDEDDDDDTIPTAEELDANSDASVDPHWGQSDNLPDHLDPDDDGDGIPTAIEANATRCGPLLSGPVTNCDNDGLPNYLDRDDDGDTVPSFIEGVADQDTDQAPNYLDSDDDNDGVLTADEDPNGNNDPTDDDSDGDKLPDYLDADSPGPFIYGDGFEPEEAEL